MPPSRIPVGHVAAAWIYPVKSMRGEEVAATHIGPRGLLGDRAYALVDVATGKVASAKNPRRWPTLFEFQAAFTRPPGDAPALPPARISLPHGGTLTTDEPDADDRLSELLGRPVHLAPAPAPGATAEGYWPDLDGLPARDEVFEFPLPEGTFFDGAAVHLVATATLDHLAALHPAGQFAVARFRPNFLVQTPDGAPGFLENSWVGRTLAVGQARLRVDGPCPRCVMTTLAQPGLPADSGVLRTAVRHNAGHVGVYASVVEPGWVRRGDSVTVL